jgi:very-short-patch-repair endonuclease
VTDLIRLRAVKLRLPTGAVFAGRTAGWLHGLDLDPTHPIEVIAPLGCGISARAGLRLRRAQLDADEIAEVQGLPATGAIRTVGDLAWLLSLTDAVAAADAGLHLGLLDLDDLRNLAGRRAGRQGAGRLRRVLELVEPLTESPMETKLRLLLRFAGLPCPLAQVSLADAQGRFVARADLFYPEARLVIEYDGATHKDSLVEDSRRQNRILAADYRLLRFTSADVLKMPDTVVAQVRRALVDLPANRAI